MPVLVEADKMGPVDVAVIAFEGSDFSGDVAPVLADLQASGTVKVIDMAFVRKASDGSTSIVELADEPVAGAFERLADTQIELLSEADLTDLAGALAPDSAAMVIVWENRWASRFASAIRESHGRVAMLERIPQENVERAISALEEEQSIGTAEELAAAERSAWYARMVLCVSCLPCSHRWTQDSQARHLASPRAISTSGWKKARTRSSPASTASRCRCPLTGSARSTRTQSRPPTALS